MTERLGGYLARRFPALAGTGLLHARVMPYEMTPDQHFLAAPSARWERHWLLGGGSGHGFKHAPGPGRARRGPRGGEGRAARDVRGGPAERRVSEPPRHVKRTYLEMRSPDALRPARVPDPAPEISRVDPPSGETCRELYLAVGQDWWWTDRQDWPIARWDAWAASTQTWVGTIDGERIGYGDLHSRAPNELELSYFGLLPGWTGRGLGGHMLTEIVRRAWETPGTERIWLSTGSLDSEAALPGYLKRGFTPFAERVEPAPKPPRYRRGA